MHDDDIMKEIRATREAFARAHDYDTRAMVATLRELNERGDWPVVSFPPRPPVRTPRRPTAEPIGGGDQQTSHPGIEIGHDLGAEADPTPRVH